MVKIHTGQEERGNILYTHTYMQMAMIDESIFFFLLKKEPKCTKANHAVPSFPQLGSYITDNCTILLDLIFMCIRN